MSSKSFTKITSSHWGAFEVKVEDGKLISTQPFQHDANPNDISNLIPKAVYHKTRVKNPFIRKGWLNGDTHRNRSIGGEDEFVEVSWDEALNYASDEIDRVRKTYGYSSIFGGSYGWSSAGKFHHAQTQLHRFLNSIGGFVSSFGSYSTAAAQAIVPHIL